MRPNIKERNFSIILPVRNGMPYIIDSVNSVLNQNYSNFELHILDNNSSDGTLEWCQSIQDKRVKVSTSESSLSIEDSWGRITGIKKLEFITMFAHDDVFLPNFLKNINILINRYPDANLFQTNGELIDNNGNLIRKCQPIKEIETSKDYLHARFSAKRDVFGTGYVMRSDLYDALGGIPKFNKLSFADDALWLMLINDGFKACCKTNSIQVRIHDKSVSATNPSNWFGFLEAIKQFSEFLDKFEKQNADSFLTLAYLKKTFFKSYLINIYILGLLHNAENRKDFSNNELNLFVSTYESLSESSYTSMRLSLKVLPIFILYKISPPLLIFLWRIYQAVRSR